MRENTAFGLEHPEWVNGRRLWTDPEVKRIVHLMQNGCPTLGWSGDPFLALYRGDNNTWVVNRWDNGQYHTVCISRPGLALDERLIKHLVDHDLQRQTAQQLFAAVDKENARLQKNADDKAADSIGDALMRAYWHAGKEIGHHYG